ncbi:sulfurtransferase [Nocardia miyunensis]|uniref:sulfurtransferase n=1 Tax=Nocardia miyunensis TaxID=282684 RepID=UPI00082B1831|nr:rhodanese-like domain-containing protein [Nocardia miyunensis]
MTDLAPSRIVSTTWLADRSAEENVVVVEVTDDPAHDGRSGVIPGAHAVFWKDLLWHATRREFATADTLAERLRALGAGAGSMVVLAGDPPQFAAYALWVATAVGVGGSLRYLDGGLPAWRRDAAAGVHRFHRAGAADVATPLPVVTPSPSVVIDRDGVRDALHTSTVIVDLRSPEEYSGARVAPSQEPIDHGAQRHGRIPGARPLHVRELLDASGRILPPDELRSRISELDAENAPELVFYCRLSHRAALGWLVFTDLLHDPRVRVYDGSWTEWGSIVGAPIER